MKSTSVSPGAVMKNGICVVAIGLGDAVKDKLLSFWRGTAAASYMDHSPLPYPAFGYLRITFNQIEQR